MLKKSFILVLLFFTVTFLCYTENVVYAENTSLNNVVYRQYSYSFDINNEKEKKVKMDYIFIGKILNVTNDVIVDIYDENIPYIIYEVEVIQNFNKNIKKDVIYIAYPGGYDSEGVFHVTNSNQFNDPFNSLPKINEFYMMSIQSKNIVDLSNSRVAYKVSVSEYIQHLSTFDIKKTQTLTYDDYISSLKELSTEDIPDTKAEGTEFESFGLVIDDGGDSGGNEKGSSFDNPHRLARNVTFEYTIYPGEELYFKFYRGSSYNVIFESKYSTSQIDTVGYLYDSNRNYIKMDNNSGYGSNFKIENWGKDSEVYYLKIKGRYSYTQGNFKITTYKDPDCSCINDPEDLVRSYSSMGANNVMHYTVDSGILEDYAFLAAQVWNNLGYVTIKEYSSGTINDLKIVTNSDPDDTRTAYWDYNLIGPDKIAIREGYLNSYSYEDIKHTLIHEFGHALGIAHMHSYGSQGNPNITVDELESNIMHYGGGSTIILDQCDINAFYHLYR